MTNFLAVDIDTQTAAFVVALTVLIPEDSDISAMIGDIVKAEPIPFAFGDKGIDLDSIVVARDGIQAKLNLHRASLWPIPGRVSNR